MNDIPKNVALVYDRVNKWGGAEQVLLALHEIFPQAHLYTSVYNSSTAEWAKVFPKVIPSFLQYAPYAKSHHEFYPWLTPLAFESFNFNQYEAVISVTSADAKGIVTQPSTFHLCYCLTPTRYLWSHFNEYQSFLDPTIKLSTKPVFDYLKSWDKIASKRPDSYVSISNVVKNRVMKYYGQESQIVYPPSNIDVYSSPVAPLGFQDFFLSVGRLVSYKQPDRLIDIFNELDLPLVMIGQGSEENRLKKIAGPKIKLLGHVAREELVAHYQSAKALVSVHEEDFGIVYAEAQSAGLPILALDRGGVSEIVIHGKTGHLAKDIEELKKVIKNFDPSTYNPQLITDNSRRFSKQRFMSEFAKVFKREWDQYKNTSTF